MRVRANVRLCVVFILVVGHDHLCFAFIRLLLLLLLLPLLLLLFFFQRWYLCCCCCCYLSHIFFSSLLIDTMYSRLLYCGCIAEYRKSCCTAPEPSSDCYRLHFLEWCLCECARNLCMKLTRIRKPSRAHRRI